MRASYSIIMLETAPVMTGDGDEALTVSTTNLSYERHMDIGDDKELILGIGVNNIYSNMADKRKYKIDDYYHTSPNSSYNVDYAGKSFIFSPTLKVGFKF